MIHMIQELFGQTLSDVTPEISHWRADVRIGVKLKIETD
jgi:hypothetical protein